MSTLKTISIVHPSGSTTNITNDSSGNMTVGGTMAMSSSFMRNRIINGAMVIDQRNAGAAVTTSGFFPLDRFTEAFGNASCSFQQVSDAPTGFINSLKLTVTTGSAPSVGTNNVILQKIEGLNVADFGLGSASAVTFTLSFWVKGSVTGTYAASFTNSAFSRSYVATYTINAANTWEYKTVTVAGDTSGTWLTTNGTGLTILWDFGSGSNLNTTAGSWQTGNYYRTSGCTTIASTTGATFAITGVQLEVGSVATPFEREIYSQTLAKCQRYYAQVGSPDGSNSYAVIGSGRNGGTTTASIRFSLPVTPRATPSASLNSATYALWEGTNNRSVGALSIYSFSSDGCEGDLATSGATTGAYVQLRGNAGSPNKPFIAFSMEL
jgi:hypothetical protein